MQSNRENEITEYQFMSFSEILPGDTSKAQTYKFKDIDSVAKKKANEISKEQMAFERSKAKENDFAISPIVVQHRKLKRHEEEEFEQKVAIEVERRFVSLREEARLIGIQEGREQGQNEIFQQQKIIVEEKLEMLQNLIDDVLRRKDEIYKNQDKEIYLMVKNLTKWVVLRELRDDSKYLERLFEKMLLELQTRTNLLIKVSAHDFNKMPEVLEAVQANLGKLQNVRLEIDKDIQTTGFIVESENGIINGTLDQQLKGIDRLFEAVGVYES